MAAGSLDSQMVGRMTIPTSRDLIAPFRANASELSRTPIGSRDKESFGWTFTRHLGLQFETPLEVLQSS